MKWKLTDGEPFFLAVKEENKNIKVKLIWAPGLNPCKNCWEIGNKFYMKKNE